MPFISIRIIQSEVSAEPISFTAGEDLNILCATIVELQATVLTGDIANHTFEWEQLSGTPVVLNDANTLTPWFVNPQTGDLVFRLWVDRDTPFEKFSDVNIFRELATVTSNITNYSELSSARSITLAARMSSEDRLVQNVRVAPIAFSDQNGTPNRNQTTCKNGPFFIDWDPPSSTNPYSIFLGVDVERWSGGQWVLDTSLPATRTYFNMTNGETYRLVNRWFDTLRGIETRETDNQPYKGHINSDWGWLGATVVSTTSDFARSTTVLEDLQRINATKFTTGEDITNIDFSISSTILEAPVFRINATKFNTEETFTANLENYSGLLTSDTAISRANGITIG